MTAPDSVERVVAEMRDTNTSVMLGGRADYPQNLIAEWADRLQALARGPQQAGGEDAWSALETWLGTFADSIPAQAYHELCAIQRSIAADKEFLRGVIDSGRQQQAELLQRAETAEAALREAQANDRRYRFLRDRCNHNVKGWHVQFSTMEPSLDAAIDAAIGGTGDA